MNNPAKQEIDKSSECGQALSGQLLAKLKSIRRRLAWNLRLSRFATISTIAVIVAFCYQIITRFVNLGDVFITIAWIIAAGGLFAAVVSIFRNVSMFRASLAADHRCNLAERVSTAYELSGRESCSDNKFALAVITDANGASSKIDPETAAPFRFPGLFFIQWIILFLMLTTSYMPTTYAQEQARENELQASVRRIRIDLSQAAGEIERAGRGRRNAALAAEIRGTREKLDEKSAESHIRNLSRKLSEKRRSLDEQKAVVRHFKRSRLLAGFAQDLKEGIPSQAESAAKRVGQRLRLNPRQALREDTAAVIKRLLKEMTSDSELRRNLTEAEAALEAGDVEAFEDALARIAGRFKSDIDEKALNLAEAVTAAARQKLGIADGPGILIGGTAAAESGRTEGAYVPLPAPVGEAAPSAPVVTVDIPERFRPVVRKYFARGTKSNTIGRN